LNKRIIFIHSLNNFTGSPNILSILIREFVSKGYQVDLITNKSYGFLSDIENINYRYTSYKWCKSKILTLFLLFWSQIEMFFIILIRYRNVKGLFYINTIIPFGAAWACKILRKEMVYHVHENMLLSKPLYPIYRFTYKYCHQKSIFVSKYLQQITSIQGNSIVAYNSLSPDFSNKILHYNQYTKPTQKNILMVGSLRQFKGVYEFIELSKQLTQFSFELVVSASSQEVEKFKIEVNPPINLKIFCQQTNLHHFYQRSKLLLNLTHPDKWIETFGLTILEAMAYGVPAIVPSIGGPTELIENGINGYTINPKNISEIAEKICDLINNKKKYEIFSKNSLNKFKEFNFEKMISRIENFINN